MWFWAFFFRPHTKSRYPEFERLYRRANLCYLILFISACTPFISQAYASKMLAGFLCILSVAGLLIPYRKKFPVANPRIQNAAAILLATTAIAMSLWFPYPELLQISFAALVHHFYRWLGESYSRERLNEFERLQRRILSLESEIRLDKQQKIPPLSLHIS